MGKKPKEPYSLGLLFWMLMFGLACNTAGLVYLAHKTIP